MTGFKMGGVERTGSATRESDNYLLLPLTKMGPMEIDSEVQR